MRPKQSNSPPCVTQLQRKLFMEKALRSKWRPVFSSKLVMWRLFHLSIVARSILSGTPQFVCLKSSAKLEKRTREHELLFTITMPTVTHRLKPALFRYAGQNFELMAYSRYSLDLASNDFFMAPHIKKEIRAQRFSSNTIFLPN